MEQKLLTYDPSASSFEIDLRSPYEDPDHYERYIATATAGILRLCEFTFTIGGTTVYDPLLKSGAGAIQVGVRDNYPGGLNFATYEDAKTFLDALVDQSGRYAIYAIKTDETNVYVDPAGFRRIIRDAKVCAKVPTDSFSAFNRKYKFGQLHVFVSASQDVLDTTRASLIAKFNSAPETKLILDRDNPSLLTELEFLKGISNHAPVTGSWFILQSLPQVQGLEENSRLGNEILQLPKLISDTNATFILFCKDEQRRGKLNFTSNTLTELSIAVVNATVIRDQTGISGEVTPTNIDSI